MSSGMISKIAKAHQYAEQRDRFDVRRLEVTVRGNNGDHTVTLEQERWSCDCDFFAHHATCAHTMALEILLEGMLPEEVRYSAA